jgi:hypothetical protein
MRLIALQSTISPTLVRLNPHVGHHIATRQTRHKVPSLIGKKSSILLHRTTPVQIARASRTDVGIGESPRPKNPGRLPGHHRMGVTMIPMDDPWVVHGRLHPRAAWWRRRWWRQRRCRRWRRRRDDSGDGGGGGVVKRRL